MWARHIAWKEHWLWPGCSYTAPVCINSFITLLTGYRSDLVPEIVTKHVGILRPSQEFFHYTLPVRSLEAKLRSRPRTGLSHLEMTSWKNLHLSAKIISVKKKTPLQLKPCARGNLRHSHSSGIRAYEEALETVSEAQFSSRGDGFGSTLGNQFLFSTYLLS